MVEVATDQPENILARWRIGAGGAPAAGAAKRALRALARRHRALTAEIDELDAELLALCEQANPALLGGWQAAFGGVGRSVGHATAVLTIRSDAHLRCAMRHFPVSIEGLVGRGAEPRTSRPVSTAAFVSHRRKPTGGPRVASRACRRRGSIRRSSGASMLSSPPRDRLAAPSAAVPPRTIRSLEPAAAAIPRAYKATRCCVSPTRTQLSPTVTAAPAPSTQQLHDYGLTCLDAADAAQAQHPHAPRSTTRELAPGPTTHASLIRQPSPCARRHRYLNNTVAADSTS